MVYHVDVTQADIDNGVAGKSESCPVAIAVSRAMESGVRVALGRVFVDDPRRAQPYFSSGLLPLNAREFIGLFDNHKPVQPFAFDVDMKEGI